LLESLKDIGIDTEERTGRVVALPASTKGVAALVNHAADARLVVAPHWLDGDGLSADWVYVSLERLAEVEEVAPADLIAAAGAGVTIGQLESALADRNLYWPVADAAGPLLERLASGGTAMTPALREALVRSALSSSAGDPVAAGRTRLDLIGILGERMDPLLERALRNLEFANQQKSYTVEIRLF